MGFLLINLETMRPRVHAMLGNRPLSPALEILAANITRIPPYSYGAARNTNIAQIMLARHGVPDR